MSTKGGEVGRRDVMGYATPKGPKGIDNSGPGLGGDNYGPCGSQGETSCYAETSGSPGLGGTNHGNTGTQGKH